MPSATVIAAETESPASHASSGARPVMVFAHRDDLGPRGRRMLIGGVVAAHVLGGWALMRVDAVRSAVREVAPVLMVNMISPPEPPKPAPPPPPAPAKRAAPTPAPIIAAAPSPAPAPATFVAPPPPPEPAPPAPVQVAAPPAPPAPAPAPVVAAGPRQIAPSAVRYIRQPAASYPALSKRNREQGVVVLRITVDASGHLREVKLHKSSGFDRLDQAALMDIRSARFAPYMEDGKPVEWQTLAPLEYSL